MEPSELYRIVKSGNPFICPELISREELVAYSAFIEDKAESEVSKTREKELDKREEELDDYASSLENILKTTKAEVLSKLRSLCSPEAYGKLAPIVEKVYSNAEKELGGVYESETLKDPTKDMTHAEIVMMMETPPIKP